MNVLPRTLACSLLVSSFFPGIAVSQSHSKPASKIGFDKTKYTIACEKFVLKNGLTLLVNEDHSVPVVSVNTWYHVGSKNEMRGRTGFAHLFEHFFFNGSSNYPHGFREAMDNVGANNRNGTTNNDRTNFFEDVPVSALERTLYLEADRMGFLALSKEMLERERGVVQNEKRQGENQPFGRVFSELPSKLYPAEHPYSWSVIGSMDDLNAATMDDIKNWYQQYYGPNNAVLILSGDIKADSALKLVKKYYDGIPPVAPASRMDNWVPKLSHNLHQQTQDRIPQTHIFRTYHVPGWKSTELDYLRLFADALGGSQSSPLYRKLVFEKQLATQVETWVEDAELSGLMYVEVYVKNDVDPVVVEKAMDSIIGGFLKTGPTQEQTDRARNRFMARFSRGLERTGGMGGRSDVLGESMTYGNSPTAYLEKLQTINAARPSDLTAAANHWLSLPHFTLQVDPYPDISAEISGVDRSINPALTVQPQAVFPAIQQSKLTNGLTIMLLERNTAPIVNLTLAMNAGFASDMPKKAGTASLALDLMNKGTTSKDIFGIANALDMVGAELNTRSDLDLSIIQLKALTQNLQPALNVFADVILHPSFPDEQFKILKTQRLSQINNEKSDPNEVVARVLPQLLYGKDHPYGMPGSGAGYVESVSNLLKTDLIQWHDSWFKPNNGVIIVTGNITMKQLLPALEKAFAAWKPGDIPVKNTGTVATTSGRKVYLVDKPGATQSVIVAAQLSVPPGQPNEPAIETFMRNFGGMSTSRLNRNLRLDKHWSYGSFAFLNAAKTQRTLAIVAPVQTDKTKESMIEVNKEIRNVAGEKLLEGEEYEGIMRNMKLRLPARFSTLQALENAAVMVYNYKLPFDYWETYPGKVNALTAAELNAASKSVVHPQEMIWLIIGDLQKVQAGIGELNYGDVIQLDADGNQLGAKK